MKLTVLLLVIGCLHVSAKGFSQEKLSLSLKNVGLKTVFKKISEKTAYRFLYQDNIIPDNIKVNVSAKNASTKDLLTAALKNTGLAYRLMNNSLIVVFEIKEEGHRNPYDSSFEYPVKIPPLVRGAVTDSLGSPLAGATVQVKGSSKAVVTDAKGNFTIDAASGDILVISSVGFETREITVASADELSIVLKMVNRNLDEIVVVGYGTVKKSDLTGAVSSVSSEKITQVKGISNVAQALQGQAAGVQVNQASGQPGQAMIIKIRGTNSMSASSQPLYVVDGLPLDALSAQLNPADIENIQILKDASSTAIYGSRGANGVVMITTKKGRAQADGKPVITYDGYIGSQTLRKKIDVLSAADFARLQNEVVTNDNASGVNATPKALPWTNAQIDSLANAGNDWQDMVYRPAFMQDHNLSVAGGSSKNRFYTSLGFFDQEGIILNSKFQRFSFRTNLSNELSKRLTLNTTLSIQNSLYREAVANADGGGGIAFTTMVIPPTQSVYDAQGNYTRFTGVQWGETNPVGISKEVLNKNNNLRIIGNTALNYNIASGLRLMLSAGVDAAYSKNDYFAPRTISIGNRQETVNGVGVPLPGVASKSYSNSTTFITENTLSYVKTINEKHNIDAVGGITYQKTRSENMGGSAFGFVTDAIQNNNLGATIASIKNGASSGYSDFALFSYLGRVNYAFDSRYLFTITGRYDGSSKFGENNKYAFFPSGALAWNVDREAFMKNSKAVSQLKLRTSYGLAGTQAINPYQTLSTLSGRSVNFGGSSFTGYVLGSLPNLSLKWETTSQFDAGIDIGFLKNRIQLTADYYYKHTKDLLLPVVLPPSIGFGSAIMNVGALQNTGFEFQLSTKNTEGIVNWSSVLTINHNRNKVLNLGVNPLTGEKVTYLEFGAGGNWFPMIVGQGMSELYGNRVVGIYGTKQEAIDNGESAKNAGDYKFENRGTSGHAVDPTDRVTLTNLQPKFTFGFNNNVDYKNFDLSILLVGSYGNDIVNEFRKYNLTLNDRWVPTYEAYEGRWKKPGDNQFDKPGTNSGGAIRDYANSLWVENGSYLRVRDITLGYSFSPALLRQIKVTAVRLFVSAQNYITVTKYSGYDPEAAWASAAVNGWDRGVYPASKSLTGGLRVTF